MTDVHAKHTSFQRPNHGMRWIVVLLLPLAGCLTETPEEALYSVHGSFTADRTQSDLDAFFARVEAWGGEGIVMESFPEQFRVTLPETDCYLFAQEVEDLDYVASVGACKPV